MSEQGLLLRLMNDLFTEKLGIDEALVDFTDLERKCLVFAAALHISSILSRGLGVECVLRYITTSQQHRETAALQGNDLA